MGGQTADDQLGRVIAALKAKGEFNDTLIVVARRPRLDLRPSKADYGDDVYRRRQR